MTHPVPPPDPGGAHPDAPGLVPCAAAAGAAGGIVSAAMDGERAALAVLRAITGRA